VYWSRNKEAGLGVADEWNPSFGQGICTLIRFARILVVGC
jgi:hypothetical protein